MVLNKIESTCSMFELTCIDRVRNYSKKEFKSEIEKIIIDDYGFRRLECCILYNCTSYIIGKKLRKLGFKKVYKYSGNDNYNLVSVYLLELNKISFFRKLFNLPRVTY